MRLERSCRGLIEVLLQLDPHALPHDWGRKNRGAGAVLQHTWRTTIIMCVPIPSSTLRVTEHQFGRLAAALGTHTTVQIPRQLSVNNQVHAVKVSHYD